MIPGTADCRSFISFFDLRTSGEEKQKGSREGQMSTVPVVVEGDAASENMFSAPPPHSPRGGMVSVRTSARAECNCFTPALPILVSTGPELLEKMTFMQKETLN